MALGFNSDALPIRGRKRTRGAPRNDFSIAAPSPDAKSTSSNAQVGEGAPSFNKTSAPSGAADKEPSGPNPFLITQSVREREEGETITGVSLNQAAIDAFDRSDPALTARDRDVFVFQVDEAEQAVAAFEREEEEKRRRLADGR